MSMDSPAEDGDLWVHFAPARAEKITLAELAMPTGRAGMVFVPDGYLHFREYANAWVINDISVTLGRRGKGLGSEMLDHLLELAELSGMRVLLECASSGMPGALTQDQLEAWYRRHGFVTDFDLDGHLILKKEPA